MTDRKRGRAGTGADRASRRWHRPIVEGLEGRELLTAQLNPIAAVASPTGTGIQVPLTSTNTDPQSYSILSNTNPAIKVTPASGQFLTIQVHHNSSGAGDPAFDGSMTFQLFDDLTPITTSKIESLVTSNYYTTPTTPTSGTPLPDKNFHRIINNFPTPTTYAVQGGSQNGDGTGNPIPNFTDEFLQQLTFTGSGQLAEANTGQPDTNNSQFFITTGSPRFADSTYTIFGQIVSGQNVLQEMTQVAKQANAQGEVSQPVSPILFTSTTLSGENPNGVLHVDTTGAAAGQMANVVVQATDLVDGTTTTQSFQVNTATNPLPTTYTPKIALGSIPNQVVTPGGSTSFTVPIVNQYASQGLTPAITLQSSISSSGSFVPLNTSQISATYNASTNQVTVTPAAGYSGSTTLLVGVRTSTAADTPSSYYYHTINVNVTAAQAPTANAASFTTAENTQIPITVTATPATAGQALTYNVPARSEHGTLTQVPGSTNQYYYTPDRNYVGPDSFTFTASTTGTSPLTSTPATVSLTVTPGTAIYAPPTAIGFGYSAAGNQPITQTLTSTDATVGQAVNYQIATQPAHGTITSFNAQTGAFTYTPAANYVGNDSFTFTATTVGAPSPGLVSTPATISLTLTPGNTNSVRVIGNVLVITPPPRRGKVTNSIRVDQVTDPVNGPVLQVTVNGVVDSISSTTTSTKTSNIDLIEIYGSKASDNISVGPEVTTRTTMSGGTGGNNVLLAGGGPTTLHGFFGRNTLTGGASDDALIGKLGSVRFIKSPGADTLVTVKPPVRKGKEPIAQAYKFVGNRLVRVPNRPVFSLITHANKANAPVT